MQSSLWKLLTAAGIIGIGTLVVLEVQNRLPARGSNPGAASALAQAAGTDTSVTPNATTELDHLLGSGGDTVELQDPASFDSSVGTGAPAPPADDSRSFGATTVSQTVMKDDVTDGANPFAVMDEPSLDAAETSEKAAEADPAFFGPSATAAETVQPASFLSDAGEYNGSPPALSLPAANATPEILFPATESESGSDSAGTSLPLDAEIPFPAEASPTPVISKKNTGAASNVRAAGTAPKSSESTATMFFNAGGKSENSASPGKTNSASSATASETKSSSRIERTATVQTSDDEPPEMFLPEPVPDVTRPAVRTPADSISAEPEVPAFDGGPAVPESNLSSGRRSGLESDPGETLPLFGIEEPATTSPGRRDGASGSATEPAPFTEDGIGLPDSIEPLPLPTADERRSRNDRTGPGARSDVIASARTVSEVMRPQLTIQKRAPDTATVGVSHDYTIVVANEGDSPAYDVVVEDELGTAADIVNTKPVGEFNRSAGLLMWAIPELKPHERKEIVVRITPTGEGTLDGVATVRFKAQVKSATVITAPKLQIEVTAPKEVKVGDDVQLQYVIRNNGTGDASSVVLRSVLPPGLKHPEGGDLEYEIPLLRAGDRETIDLTVVAAEPGEQIRVTTEVTASGVSADQSTTDIAIVGAQLSVERLGPERRFVGREATYQNIVTNESNFEAANAIVVEQIPDGMRFLSASHNGEFNPESRQVRWAIARLAPGKQAVLEIQLRAETAGQMETTVEVTENAGFRSRADENTVVTVEDLHNVTADISRQDEPVAIGERFGFTITIDNRGTAVARNVQMSVQVPPEIKVLAAGTRDIAGKLLPGNLVKYDSVLTIQPDTKMTFQLTLQGQQPVRNALVQAYLKYDEMQEPLIVSESVTVFDDQP